MFTLAILLFSALFYEVRADNCQGMNVTTLKDVRRSTLYVADRQNGEKLLCDLNIIQDDVWYRFQSAAGNKMPTTKPAFFSCGTFAPIWMDGTHPTVQDGTVKRKACANLPYLTPLGCGRSYDINVRNCGTYYIYQLKQPKQCALSYCAGE